MTLKVDIFCKVVDNFGDIGICWRLAQQLSNEHQLIVRLWVDDWKVAAQLISKLPAQQASMADVDGVQVLSWNSESDFSRVGDVVLETFACGLPESYQQAMQSQNTIWINIDHLSAEAWVDDFHAQASPQNNGLKKYFYFPGFTAQSGGLIRERTLTDTTYDLPDSDGQVTLSLFAYPHAPMSDLFDAIIKSQQATVCYVPESILLPTIAQYFDVESVHVGQVLSRDCLHVHVLPFLSQSDYDALLRRCDINFVRGEDSWVRAIWAGKPFIWQPYLQEDDVHLDKLKAFLTSFYRDQHTEIASMHAAWNGLSLHADTWMAYLEKQTGIAKMTLASQQRQMQQPDLASRLVKFWNQLLLS